MARPDRLGRRLLWHGGLLATTLCLLAPTVIAVLASLKPANDLYSDNPLPGRPTLANYQVALREFPIARLLANTLVTAGAVAILQLLVATLAAYAVVRYHTRTGQIVLWAAAISVLIPVQALLVPQFLLVAQAGWLNTFPGLAVPQVSGVGVAVLLLRQHLNAIPDSLGEAATLDGATSRQVLWYVMIPLLRPALSAMAILAFITSWNEYLWPLLAAPDVPHTTIQVGLALFTNAEGANPGPLLAAATIATAPILVAYLTAARLITDAFMHSGIH
jgi:multiple sugar transport system permease protein